MSTSQSFPISPKPQTLIEALAIIKQQAYQFKLLTNDHKIKDQTIDILKDKIKEMEQAISDYQEQISLLEEGVNEYRQEFQSKVKGEIIQNQKLLEINERLVNEKKQLEEKIKAVENEKNISKASFKEIYDEIQELRIRSSRASQAIMDTRDTLYKKQNELTEMEMKLNHAIAQKDSMNDKNNFLFKENEELLKIIEGRNSEMEEYIKMSEEYKALQKAYDQELANLTALKQSNEEWKRKHDKLECDLEVKGLEIKQQEANVKNQTVKIEGLQKQVEKLKVIITQKDSDISKLNEDIAKGEKVIKEEEEKLTMSIQRAIDLIKAEVIEFDHKVEKKSIYNDAMHKLMQSIVEQNRQVVNLREAEVVEEAEYQYLERMITELGREKEEFIKNHVEVLRNYEELEKRFQEMENVSVQEKHDIHMKFEKELEKMISMVKNADLKAQEELTSKNDEIDELVEQQNRLKEEIELQESIMKEMKDKFVGLIEEASSHKARFDKVSFVLGAFLKVFVNLLTRFKTLTNQKDFLSQYYLQYSTLKEKLAKMHLIDSIAQNPKEKTVLQRFKNVVLVIKAANRLKKAEENNRDDSIDEIELLHSLDNLPQAMKRFICGLFKKDLIGLEKGIGEEIKEALENFDGLNENMIISRIISCIGLSENLVNENIFSAWLNSKNQKARKIEEIQVNFEINSDMEEKVSKLEKKLRKSEELINRKENQYKGKIEDLGVQLEKAKEKADSYKKSNDKLVSEFDKLKEEVVELLTWIKEKGQGIYTQSSEASEDSFKQDEQKQAAKLQEKIMSLQSNMLAMRRNNMKLQKMKSQEGEGNQENAKSYESHGFYTTMNTTGFEKAMKESSKLNIA